MAEKCEEVTEVVEHFEMLTTIEQMRKALEGIKLSLKIRRRRRGRRRRGRRRRKKMR
jgi:hypothetical protein